MSTNYREQFPITSEMESHTSYNGDQREEWVSRKGCEDLEKKLIICESNHCSLKEYLKNFFKENVRLICHLNDIEKSCGTNDPDKLGEIIRSISDEAQI